MKYLLSRSNGWTATADSKKEALAIIRRQLGAINRGASYFTDNYDLVDDRSDPVYGTATDFWASRRAAKEEMGAGADIVVFVAKELGPNKAVC